MTAIYPTAGIGLSMDLGGFKLFGMLQRRMDWLGERQRVLSQNVANSDTPGHVPQDLRPLRFDQMLRSTGPVGVQRTDAAHMAGSAAGSRFGEQRQKAGEATTISGNAVDLEAELRKVSETGVDYQAMVNLYRKHVEMLRTAIGRNG
ncbi:MAG: flagellar basal body rod protein FlgB [Alphaproteobacteria bacterium]